ncbi:DUF4440 domain-containing protein [Duganella sp. FT92W]|uniref:DUF4440 domain-containing protein n=1 Tax=Pseudoduganella rivuli TaxID=2666085 RepID=A0A7X2ILA6_9BURK|nr:nuclear transport factor 2 family protein [Pseudoduganella rivuli]MRV72111.1 DUF4440 domain-containing protein [Pseudoduganella rivuli]
MKKLPALLALLPWPVLAAACQPVDSLIERDRQYEEALRTGDVPYLQAWLADDYVWVHTLASQVEDKASVLGRLKKPDTIPKSRTTSNVQAHVLGQTVVLRGLSTVEQWNADGKTWRTNQYQFMRTYADVGGQCKLLAVQSMKVASSPSNLQPLQAVQGSK